MMRQSLTAAISSSAAVAASAAHGNNYAVVMGRVLKVVESWWVTVTVTVSRSRHELDHIVTRV